MTPNRKILAICIPLAILVVLGRAIEPKEDGNLLSATVVLLMSVLLGAVAVVLSEMEYQKRIRAVFLNFGIFFLINGVGWPLFNLIGLTCSFQDTWSRFFMNQYFTIGYFLMLAASVVFLVLERVSKTMKISRLYSYTLLFVVCLVACIFGPYFTNPKYSYTSPNVRDFKAIGELMQKLGISGIRNPTTIQIVAGLDSGWAELEASEMTLEERVEELLPYFRGNDYALLIYRDLWIRCFWMSVVSISFILVFIVYQYFCDPPGGAYIEKTAWCLLIYCLFEAFHFISYTQASDWEELTRMRSVGYYLTASGMITMIGLVTLRLNFLQSFEGQYYERRLALNPTRVTRWRDAFDTWILRKFMDNRDLDRRFLVQSGRKGKDEQPDDFSRREE